MCSPWNGRTKKNQHTMANQSHVRWDFYVVFWGWDAAAEGQLVSLKKKNRHHPPEEQPEFYHDFTPSFFPGILGRIQDSINQHWSTVINCSVQKYVPTYIQDLFQEWILASSWIGKDIVQPPLVTAGHCPRFRHRISQPGDEGAGGQADVAELWTPQKKMCWNTFEIGLV